MKKLFNSSFRRFVGPCTTAALVLLAAGAARADSIYTVTLEQAGSNVVAIGSGTVDLTGLTLYGYAAGGGVINPAGGVIYVGPVAQTDVYTGVTGPTSFGSGGIANLSSGTGNTVEIIGSQDVLDVPYGYVSGSALSDSSTWDNTTLAALGVTPGTYVWTWGSGANADSFTLDIGAPAAAPEPSSFLLLGIVLLAGLWLARKQMRPRTARSERSAT